MANASVEIGVKRGDTSWAYFPLAYTILITISIGIIQLIEIWDWWFRLIVLLLVSACSDFSEKINLRVFEVVERLDFVKK